MDRLRDFGEITFAAKELGLIDVADIALLDKGVWEARVQANVPYGAEHVEFVANKKLIIP